MAKQKKKEFEGSLAASELALGKAGNHLKVKFGWLSESTSFISPRPKRKVTGLKRTAMNLV